MEEPGVGKRTCQPSAVPLPAISKTRIASGGAWRSHEVRSSGICAHGTAIVITSLLLRLGGIASARVTSRFPALLPSATITSDDSGSARNNDPGPADSAPPSPVPISPPAHHSQRRHRASVPVSSPSAGVEATHAMVKLKKDAWAY